MNDKESWTGVVHGPGSAAPPAGWRPDRILSRRWVNLGATAAGSAGVVLIALNLFFGAAPKAATESWNAPEVEMAGVATPIASPVSAQSMQPTPTLASAAPAGSTRRYAVALTELRGLPADAPSGTQLEMWVIWDRPVTSRPKMQRLIPLVTLERIAPPIAEGAPSVALLQVRPRDIPDLLWGDRYGTLSVVLLSTV